MNGFWDWIASMTCWMDDDGGEVGEMTEGKVIESNCFCCGTWISWKVIDDGDNVVASIVGSLEKWYWI
ncbi:hypothetical protein LINPERHAP2_LOCUS33023, partial [Linum perenne]